MSGSLAFAVAIDRETGCAVAMGRAISDGTSDAYIQDLVVKKDYRESGIGRKVLSTLVRLLPGPWYYLDSADCGAGD